MLVGMVFFTIRLFMIDTAAQALPQMKIKANSRVQQDKFPCQQWQVQLLSILRHQHFGPVETPA